MDLGIILGLVLALGSIVASLLIDKATVTAYINVSAIIIVFGGSIGATLVTCSLETFVRFPVLVKNAIFNSSFDSREFVEQVCSYCTLVRRDGMLALEKKLDEQKDPFVRKALQLVIDGLDGSTIVQILENDIEAMERRHKANYTMFTVMGGYAPAMGILGTVLGLINMLMGLGDSTEGLGSAVAVAFLTTLYGVMLANLVCLPVAANLKSKSENEVVFRRVVIEGMLALVSGENPRLLKDRLTATAGLRVQEAAEVTA